MEYLLSRYFSHFVIEQLELYKKRKHLISGRTQDLISKVTFQLLQKQMNEEGELAGEEKRESRAVLLIVWSPDQQKRWQLVRNAKSLSSLHTY